MWRGGFNPPARFLVPLIPVFAAGLALVLQRGLFASTALLAGWGLWCGLAGALNIETIHRDRDGVAPFFRSQAGAREWTAALPSFVLAEDRPTRGLAVPWAILLLLPVVGAIRAERGASRSSTSRQVVVAVAAFLTAAVVADQASPRARSPERDATRRMGEPSILVPALRYELEPVAVWSIDLLYEPHRHPEGQRFARQVRLSPGRYELTLQCEEPPAGPPPMLLFADQRTGQVGSEPMRAGPLTLKAAFAVLTPGEFDLRLSGGSPGTFEFAHLRRVGD
jgi:hypothetical protein